jgi:hypothetical protein
MESMDMSTRLDILRSGLFLFLIGVLSFNAVGQTGTITGAVAAGSNAGISREEISSLLKNLESSMLPAVASASMRMISFRNGKSVKTIDMNFKVKSDNVLIDIQAPAVDKGKYILKSEDNLWMYFSKIKRSIRIASRDSFMGTDASNYDLLELNLIDDYELKSVEETTLDNRKVYRLELYAKPNTAGYNQIVSWIDTEERRIIKNDCYAISGTMIKTINYESYEKVESYQVPSRINITNHLENGRNSIIEISKVTAIKNLDESTFSLGYLESLN